MESRDAHFRDLFLTTHRSFLKFVQMRRDARERGRESNNMIDLKWWKILTCAHFRYSQLLLIFKGWYASQCEQQNQRNDKRSFLIDILYHWVTATSFPEFDKVAAMQTLLFLRETVLRDFPSHPTVLALMRCDLWRHESHRVTSLHSSLIFMIEFWTHFTLSYFSLTNRQMRHMMRESHAHLFGCCIPQQSLPFWKAIRFVPQEESRKKHFLFVISEIQQTFSSLSSPLPLSSSLASSSSSSFLSFETDEISKGSVSDTVPSPRSSRLSDSLDSFEKDKVSLSSSKEKEKREKNIVSHDIFFFKDSFLFS